MTLYIPIAVGGGAVSPTVLTANVPAETPLTINAVTGQTADLLDVFDASGTKRVFVNSAGNLNLWGASGQLLIQNVGGTGGATIGRDATGGGLAIAANNGNNTISTGASAANVALYAFPSGREVQISGAGTDRNTSFAGTGSYGAGRGVIFIANDIADPSANPVGGGILYVSAGSLKFRGSSGTVTSVAPA